MVQTGTPQRQVPSDGRVPFPLTWHWEAAWKVSFLFKMFCFCWFCSFFACDASAVPLNGLARPVTRWPRCQAQHLRPQRQAGTCLRLCPSAYLSDGLGRVACQILVGLVYAVGLVCPGLGVICFALTFILSRSRSGTYIFRYVCSAAKEGFSILRWGLGA